MESVLHYGGPVHIHQGALRPLMYGSCNNKYTWDLTYGKLSIRTHGGRIEGTRRETSKHPLFDAGCINFYETVLCNMMEHITNALIAGD